MTEYAYYSASVGPGPDGPVWRYPEGQEHGVYLRRDHVEPAVARRDDLAEYKGYRQLAESEVPAWAKPSVFEYAPGRLLRGRTQGSRSLVEGEFEHRSDSAVVVELTKVLDNRREVLEPFPLGAPVNLDPATVEAVTPGEVNVKVALDTSEFVEALEKARTAFEGGGVRDSVEKTERFELAWTADQAYEDQMLTRYARWMARGADKYADRNWESFSSDDALEHAKGSLLRHVFKLLAGQVDEDHAAAVWFNVAAIELIRGKD